MGTKFATKQRSILLIAILFVSFFAQSCLQAPSSSRKSMLTSSSSTNPTVATKLPKFTEGNNFIQNGGVVYTAVVDLELTFTDSIQLRGKDVDTYIRNNGTQTISCLTANFSDSLSTLNEIQILAAVPHSVYNFSSQTLEYYYSIAPSDGTTNQNFCQKTGLITKLGTLYNTATTTYSLNYKIADLCQSASCSTIFTSQSLELFSQSGNKIFQVPVSNLTFSIKNRPVTTTPTNGCVAASECKAQGFDCCSSGQCVKDLSLKPGVDKTASTYVQALQDILNTPSHIYNYPQYYFICSSTVNQPSTAVPGTTTDPINEAAKRLNNLTDLYNCVSKIEGEMGVCTITYPNALLNTTYSAGRDDRNFSGTYTNQPSGSYTPTEKEELSAIEEVLYGDVSLFKYDEIALDATLRPDPYVVSSYLTINGHHNDDTSSGTSITLSKYPSTAVSKDLVIRYRTDSSCKLINSTLASCEKYYIQGQQKSGDTLKQNRRGRITDHYPASNYFKLPSYANTSKLIRVEVDGIVLKQGSDWQLNLGSNPTIEFISTAGELKVYDNQKIKISFFVDTSVNHVMDSKIEALSKIQQICHCASLDCGLSPIKDGLGNVKDYACVYPDPNPVEPPVSQKVYLSSKSVPVRFFDTSGASKASVNADSLPQEGKAFYYRKDNLLDPNNLPDLNNPTSTEDTYVGFNEIYGSLSYKSNSAKPALEVNLTKGKSYDLYVDFGSYSNCVQCGNDYYSQLNKLFPTAQFAGGLVPLQNRTDRTLANGVPADDFSFGRACFVPATMIPWTHNISTDPEEQRRNRMYSQHFLYANGYQRDWYGFDYGSVIGSFDGVKWFSIGSNRRIKADTNKLFLAVNGLFGDLALETTYTVSINDASLNPIGANMVTKDSESDGAQCQKYHQCVTDNDCATSLGWDYICSEVNEYSTNWPVFDDNAKEMPDTNISDGKLSSILSNNVAGKRCVYRGRGAACTPNYANVNINSTFNGTTSQSQHSCAPNFYCRPISANGVGNNGFNNRIVRYGKIETDDSFDHFGLGTKVPGRPWDYNPVETIRSEASKNLNYNKVSGVCMPGRSPEASSLALQNSTTPSSEYLGDKTLNQGMTLKSNTPKENYLTSCPIFNSSNNYFITNSTSPSAIIDHTTTPDLVYNSGTQAISTNALSVFNSIFQNKGMSLGLITSINDPMAKMSYGENRCMRAPGASCFSDSDCAPTKQIATKIKMLSPNDSIVTNLINTYELKFWQEELVCSQATPKSDATYLSSNNRCCREVGKSISIATGDVDNNLYMEDIPGLSKNMNEKNRYSRVATVFKDQMLTPTTYPKLFTAVANQCTKPGFACANAAALKNQYKTFSAYAERTSCSGDWIRNFSNGTHSWASNKFQYINPSNLRCLNWAAGRPATATVNFSCAGLEKNDPDCSMIQTTPQNPNAKKVLSYFARFELLGIPQIAFESEQYFNDTSPDFLSCISDPDDQDATYPGNPSNPAGYTGNYKMVPGIIPSPYPAGEFSDSGKKQYSATDMTNFNFDAKMIDKKSIFKADEVVSCYAAGTRMAAGADPSLCCTGFINTQNNLCQLPDFVDVSVYTNRFVSSEAKKISDTLIDQYGYVTEPSIVAQLACERRICASGKLATGVLISKLPIPGQSDIDKTQYYRYLENSSVDDEHGVYTLFKSGLKLNNHVYCAPQNLSANGDNISNYLNIYNCQ